MVVLALLVWAPAGQAQVATPAAAQPLSLDAAIRTGTLPNGLTYFIRRNTRPEKRLTLRLAVEAGSIDEADDQRGLAHVLEHMAFNGSAHFKPGELVSYLESIGASFGPHVNAYTSYDETVYMLDVPTDRAGVVTRGFEALSDFAGGVTLDESEINRERGVVIEEWRGRLGAGTRMQEPQIAALFGTSKYASRLPIGTPDILRTFTPQRLRDFYRDHYRPDRMAVIAVGDIDPDMVERLIRDLFGPMRAAAPAARALSPIPGHAETRYVTLSDPEAQGSSVTIVHKKPLETFRSAADYRRLLVRSLVAQMVNDRFGELARAAEAPFLRASYGGDEFGRDTEAISVSARVNDGTIDKGLAALQQEIIRVRQFGFGEAELERAKRDMLASYERAFNERSTAESGGYASELVRHFLSGEPVPGIERELEIVRRYLPEITAADAAAAARASLGEENRVVLATAPQKPGIEPVSEAALQAALRAGTNATVAPWRDEMAGRELMAEKPAPGTVAARREIPELGTTVLTLSNGVEVWLKPTDFRNDQVLFTAYARGGTSLAAPTDYENASLSTSLVGIAGVGGLSPVDLGKLLSGKLAGASPYMSTATHGISGSATPKDLETALQLVHLYFTTPNNDAAAFALMRRRLEASLANAEQNPGTVFGERVRAINTSNHYTARAFRLSDLPSLNPQRMNDYYQARFANAADFTFFFVGAFKVDDVIPLLTTYLATLDSTGVKSGAFKEAEMTFPAASVRETVRKGQEPRSQTIVSFFADTRLDELEAHRARAAAQVLQMRLRDILREQLGGTYSVGVGYSDNAPQSGYGTVSVQFGSSPENADTLTKAVLTEIERLQREGPSAVDVNVVKETERNDLQTALKQNGFWLNALQLSHVLQRDPLRINRRLERVDSLTAENIQAALQKYFKTDRYTVVTLMPEER